MPYAPAKPCYGCQRAGRWPGGRCPECLQGHRKRVDQARPALRERGWYHTERWKRLRRRFLSEHPLCSTCQRPANTVDHKEPHRMDERKFWDWANLNPQCQPCHSRKTATFDGGFGNRLA